MFWDDVMDSVWIGGKADHSGAGHERGPYWLNGVVPLSAHLNATGDSNKTTLKVDLQAQVQKWIYYILDHQLPSGWLGPDDGYGGKGNTYWNGWNIAAALLQYADNQAFEGRASVAARCNVAVLRYIKEVHRRMLTVPTSSWSQNRWQDWAYIAHWMMDQAPQGEEQLLWDAAELTQQQSWDWDAYYEQTGVGRTGAYVGKTIPKFPEYNVGGWTMYDHGVNNAMGTKSCAVWYRQSQNESDRKAAYQKLSMQDRYHGQPHGMFAGDECFGGRALNRGIELCAVVEQMYSFQHNFKVFGDPFWMDRCERIAFNSLPATIDPLQWRHQYLQQANEINAKYGLRQHVWQTDGPDSTGFGVAPNFGCCTANFNQGWPKFASNVFLSSPEDGGLVLAMIAPVTVRVPNDGGDTVAEVITDYPFGDIVTIKVSVNGTRAVPLYIRVPDWAIGAEVTINGEAPSSQPINGTLYKLVCDARASTTVVLSLHPKIRVEKTWGLPAQHLQPPVVYSPSGAVPVPSDDVRNDFDLHGGAAIASSRLPGAKDLRSGDPGGVALIVLNTPIFGESHWLSDVKLSFRYLAGYTPRAGEKKNASTVELVVLDGSTHSVLQSLYTSPPLDKYSWDHGDKYSPPVQVSLSGLRIPNAAGVVLALKVQNNQRNLQIPVVSGVGLGVAVSWTAAKSNVPPSPPRKDIIPATDAAAVLRGPLLYSLELIQTETTVRTWPTFGNTDVNFETTSQWNMAIDLGTLKYVPSPGGMNRAIPFNISNYFAWIQASARPVPSWNESANAANEPPASPINCTALNCGDPVAVRMVPYGATNIRMSALPWFG